MESAMLISKTNSTTKLKINLLLLIDVTKINKFVIDSNNDYKDKIIKK